MDRIKRALISVYDKTGIVELARDLSALGVEILSTGGTHRLLAENGIAAVEVATHTGHPEILDGRVKTLHPRIHGGLLGQRNNPEHRAQMAANGIVPIDLVVVNLYPFAQTIAQPGVTLATAIENIDIGGPAMLRSAAKNHADVIVVVHPTDYADVLDRIKTDRIDQTTRHALACKVFAYTAEYDRNIADYLSAGQTSGDTTPFPQRLTLGYEKAQSLRYGENPHQSAALYRLPAGVGLAFSEPLCGKEMSYNNYLDAHAALELVSEFAGPACVIVKHNNPCGVATAERLDLAYPAAKACDPVSAFGGVVAVNRTLDLAAAQAIGTTFTEVVVAPDITPDALALLSQKKGLRVLRAGRSEERWEMRRVGGGLLLQEIDRLRIDDLSGLKVASRRAPTAEERAALGFAWTVCKHVKSNAIVFARGGQTVGIGAGQMSRVDSVKIAVMKAQASLAGCAMASDAFFPFRDGIDEAARAGITAVIQPGGSIRDSEVIQAADDHGMAMLLAGIRHFRH